MISQKDGSQSKCQQTLDLTIKICINRNDDEDVFSKENEELIPKAVSIISSKKESVGFKELFTEEDFSFFSKEMKNLKWTDDSPDHHRRHSYKENKLPVCRFPALYLWVSLQIQFRSFWVAQIDALEGFEVEFYDFRQNREHNYDN